MSFQENNQSQTTKAHPSSRYACEYAIEACPSEFLKTVDSLKNMGLSNTFLELSFKTISGIELFTRILNRQQDQERVANELKITYFHNIRGKVKKTEMNRNQEFVTMKKMKFNSSYHVTLFMKYYDDRIKQLQNQYRYTLVSGIDGHLHVYLNDDDSISSMFINEIRDMKKRLQFLEVKDMELCQKFIYSQQLARQLNKIGIHNEIWYRGKQSTIIFYSENQSLSKIKKLVNTIAKYHISILKLQDQSLPFLINYLLFDLLKKSIQPDIFKLKTIENQGFQFTENKIGIVLHDKHELFSSQIIEQVMNKMKNYLLFTLRAKDARKFLNLLKKQFNQNEYVKFCYSKKTVCVCINTEKLKSYAQLKKLFGQIPYAVNQDSQLTFNWFHLQGENMQDYCKSLSERMIMTLSASQFHVQNFQKLMQNKVFKCVLKLKKNISKDKRVLSQRVGDTLINIIKAWKIENTVKQNQDTQLHPDNIKCQIENLQQNFGNEDQNNSEQEEESSDNEQSEYQDVDTDQQDKDTGYSDNNRDQELKVAQQQCGLKIKGIQIENSFTEELKDFFKQNQPRFFKSQSNSQDEWKETKSWRKAEELLHNELKITARIKFISLNQVHSQQVNSIRQKMVDEQDFKLSFHEFISYSMKMFESPFYKDDSEKVIVKFEDLKVGDKQMICCEKQHDDQILSFPLCSIEVLKKL